MEALVRTVTALARALVLPAGALLLAAMPVPAGAYPMRSPQVVLDPGPLASYLDAVDIGINPLTDQLDAQVWDAGSLPDFIVVLRRTTPGGSVGLYNALDAAPQLVPILPANAAPGWCCVLHFALTGTLITTLFDANSVFAGQQSYPGVDQRHFGFYFRDPAGTFYSQDARNGGSPQALTFQSNIFVGPPPGMTVWYECFEGAVYGPSATFAGGVFTVETPEILPARARSWGSLKASYR